MPPKKRRKKIPVAKPQFTDLCVPYLPSLTSSLNPSHLKSSYLRTLNLYSTFSPLLAYFESEITHDTILCPPPPLPPPTKKRNKFVKHVKPTLKILSRHSIHITSTSTNLLKSSPHDLVALLPTSTLVLSHILSNESFNLSNVDLIRLKPGFKILKNHLTSASSSRINFEIPFSTSDLAYLKICVKFWSLRKTIQTGFKPDLYFVDLKMGYEDCKCFLVGVGLEGEMVERGLRGWRGGRRGGGEFEEDLGEVVEEEEEGGVKKVEKDGEEDESDESDESDEGDEEEGNNNNKTAEVEDGFLSF
ncbi:hypothetical protein TrLO_g3755 [Triparma laevis f. longispina]|uniref:Uncharacterized protein n=1 Tax=Triparma laevis f. longispina TaxID=1714387 RepID=A0A9W7FRJ6_9STRA|nr:hypothetical protein TrLO_g3755 [Triparma laevis f. longispina]